MFKYQNFTIVAFILFLSFQLSAQQNVTPKDEEVTKIMEENVELLETDPDVALLNLKKLRDQYIKSNPRKAIGIVAKILDVLARTKGDNHQLLKESEIGLKLANKHNAFGQLSLFYQYRSAAYISEGLSDLGYRELEMAILYTNKITDINEKNITFAHLYGGMSEYYHLKNDISNEHLYINKSLATLAHVHDTSAPIISDIRFIKAQRFERLGTIFYRKNQFDSSEFYLLEAYKLHNQNDPTLPLFDKTAIVLSLSDFYYFREDYRKAIQYAKVGLGIRKENKQPFIKRGFYDVLHKSYLKTDQIDSSKYYSDLYDAVDDSLHIATDSGLNETFERHSEMKEVAHRANIQKLIIIGLSILIIIAVITAYWIRISRKRLHQKYEDLITKINQPATAPAIEPVNIPLASEETSNKEGIYIPEETITALLKKLDRFERSAKYIKKNITLASMATDMDTNTRYISELIKEYRGKNFNNYINGLRIEFITKKLHDDPQFRKYKVAYLAEYAGFSSGANFTAIFKKETGITPSYFISQLEKKD